MKQDYAVMGGVMLNDLYFADGTSRKHLIGGGGLFALSGIRLWTDHVHFIGNIGRDFEEHIAPWWDANHISRKGLNVCHNHCTYHRVDYHPDGTYQEGSIYDEGMRHDMYMVSHPEQIEPFAAGLKGLSMVWNVNPAELQKIGELKKKYGFKVMFELNTFYCKHEYLEDILSCLEHVDIYSVNLPEAKNIFQVDTEEACIERMLAIGKPCFFRVGKKGSYVVMVGKAVFVPVVVGEHDMDPTGCGNSSTAAAGFAFAEGYDPLMIGLIANVTSCMNAQQHGPMPVMDEALREKSMALAKQLYEKMKNE